MDLAEAVPTVAKTLKGRPAAARLFVDVVLEAGGRHAFSEQLLDALVERHHSQLTAFRC